MKCGCVYFARKNGSVCSRHSQSLDGELFGRSGFKIRCLNKKIYASRVEIPMEERAADPFPLVGGVYLDEKRCTRDSECNDCISGFDHFSCLKNGRAARGSCLCQSTHGTGSNNVAAAANVVAKLLPIISDAFTAKI